VSYPILDYGSQLTGDQDTYRKIIEEYMEEVRIKLGKK
jgi:hypothetical protein